MPGPWPSTWPDTGLRARRPAALTRRTFDAALLATEPSPVADVDLDQASELLTSQIDQLGAGDPVIVVAHSAGGSVLTRAAQLVPARVAHAIYLTAFMPASGVPLRAYTGMPENEGGLLPRCVVADPAAVGALRLDVTSPDPAYRQRLREAFYGDLDPALADAAIALLSSDAPTGIGLGTTTLTAGGWGSVPRTYVVCTRDRSSGRPCSNGSSLTSTPPFPPTRPPSMSFTPRTPRSCRCPAR